MKIKIKKWEKLDVKNKKFMAKWDNLSECVGVFTVEGKALSPIGKYLPDDIKIGFLWVLGFDIELEQPRKLTWREWCYCNVFPNCWIASDKHKKITNVFCFKYETNPTRSFGDDWDGENPEKIVELFSWLKWENEPISTNEMLRWEHEPEPKCTFDE